MAKTLLPEVSVGACTTGLPTARNASEDQVCESRKHPVPARLLADMVKRGYYILLYMEVSKEGGTSKLMVDNGKSFYMDDAGVPQF